MFVKKLLFLSTESLGADAGLLLLLPLLPPPRSKLDYCWFNAWLYAWEVGTDDFTVDCWCVPFCLAFAVPLFVLEVLLRLRLDVLLTGALGFGIPLIIFVSIFWWNTYGACKNSSYCCGNGSNSHAAGRLRSKLWPLAFEFVGSAITRYIRQASSTLSSFRIPFDKKLEWLVDYNVTVFGYVILKRFKTYSWALTRWPRLRSNHRSSSPWNAVCFSLALCQQRQTWWKVYSSE